MLKNLKLPLMEDGGLDVDNECSVQIAFKRWILGSQKGIVTLLEDGG